MHILDKVKAVNIKINKPVEHYVILLDNLIIVEVLGCDGSISRSNLVLLELVNTTVDSVEQALSKISTCTEELHLLTCLCSGYAAAD